ncbi:MAG: IS6 family transposase [Candidatus Aenigmatarchaeota archaeon]
MQVRCRFCGNMHHKPAGWRRMRAGEKRIYKCLACGRKFTPDGAFLRMKNDPEVIIQCIDLYVSGLSMRAISQHMRRRGTKISHMCVYRWVRRFSKLLKPYADSFRINGQDAHLHADEMMVQLGGEWVWLWNVISKESRFVVASRMSRTRTMDDGKALFREAKSKLEGMPLKITTDGMQAYPRAVRSAFYRNTTPRTEHYVAPGITHACQNNLVERHHNTIRARTKIMRGFGEMRSASDIMDMWHVYYNFMRPHSSLEGATPAQSAGLRGPGLRSMIEDAYEWKRAVAGSG